MQAVAVKSDSLGGLLLAAGGSSRLGRPKQLCEWKGKPLLCHAVETALAVCDAGVVVVTGAHAEEVELCIKSYPVSVIRNTDWAAGMSGSLRMGIQAALAEDLGGLLVSLCDQPLVSADDLERLIAAWVARPQQPAAAHYSGASGVPAIFPRHILPELRKLHGDRGGRELLNSSPASRVEMPSAATDIDTMDDLARLKGGLSD